MYKVPRTLQEKGSRGQSKRHRGIEAEALRNNLCQSAPKLMVAFRSGANKIGGDTLKA